MERKPKMNEMFESRTLYRRLSEVVQIFLFLVASLVSGCGPVSSEQLYLVSEAGISIEKPMNWRVGYFERSGLTVVESKKNLWQNASARIEIYGNACQPSSWANQPTNPLEFNIERIRNLYNLESVKVIQESTRVETVDYEVTKAVIAIPSEAMAGDMSRLLVGDPDPDTQQMIHLFVISDQLHSIMAYLYEGENEDLNAKAQDIIESVQFICSGE